MVAYHGCIEDQWHVLSETEVQDFSISVMDHRPHSLSLSLPLSLSLSLSVSAACQRTDSSPALTLSVHTYVGVCEVSRPTQVWERRLNNLAAQKKLKSFSLSLNLSLSLSVSLFPPLLFPSSLYQSNS